MCALTYLEMNKNRYVLAVGWDRGINIYSDVQDEAVHHTQHPQPRWPDDKVRAQGEALPVPVQRARAAGRGEGLGQR